MASAVTTNPDLDMLARLRFAVQQTYVLARPTGYATILGAEARDKFDRSYERLFRNLFAQVHDTAGPESELARIGIRAHRVARRKARRRSDPKRVVDYVRRRVSLRAMYGPEFAGAYIDVSIALGTVAGQASLDELGLNLTWRFTSPRDMGRALYAVRGSKIIQSAVGNHIDDLARIIVRATDPAKPQSISQVIREIRTNWGDLTAKQVRRIARTETAAVYSSTQWHAYRANGIGRVRWLTASSKVCPTCIDNAAQGFVPIDGVFRSGHESPPAHPNCRCDLLPDLEGWLPPAEPWSGGGRTVPGVANPGVPFP